MTEKEFKILKGIYDNYVYEKEESYIDLSLVNNANELLYVYDEKMMGMELSIIFEIDDLIREGKTKEEIFNMIIDSNFENLTEEEAFYLKKRSIKTLEVRYKLYLEEINEKQKKLKNRNKI